MMHRFMLAYYLWLYRRSLSASSIARLGVEAAEKYRRNIQHRIMWELRNY